MLASQRVVHHSIIMYNHVVQLCSYSNFADILWYLSKVIKTLGCHRCMCMICHVYSPQHMLISSLLFIFHLAACKLGHIRLRGGSTAHDGQVEICNSNQVWSSVCATGWGDSDAQVACTQLGYSSSGELWATLKGQHSQNYVIIMIIIIIQQLESVSQLQSSSYH